MALEIERKFLVDPQRWVAPSGGVLFRQGYIGTTTPGRTVRVRIEGTEGRLTIKGPSQGMVRAEYEYAIPVTDAEELLETLCDRPFIEKVRYRVDHDGHTWEVDVFRGENQGLTVAEIELSREDEAFSRPGWLGVEVTDDLRYSNSRLAQEPFGTWARP